MQQIDSIPDLIDLWRTTALGRERGADIAFATDIGLKGTAVRSMRHRGAIGVRYWPKVIEAAKRQAAAPGTAKGFRRVSADFLMKLHTQALDRKQTESTSKGRHLAA